MNLYEASSFYGDYRMLLNEVAEELSNEKVDSTVVAAKVFEDVSFTMKNSVLKS